MGSETVPPKKTSSDSNSNGDTKEKDGGKKSGAKGNKVETTIASVVAENSAQQTQSQSQQHIEKAKDLKSEVPVVSAAGTSLNEDAHHITNVKINFLFFKLKLIFIFFFLIEHK